jgi:hypothetical protein
MTLTERGQREVAGSLRDVLARLRRRRAVIREQIDLLTLEEADLAKIESAVVAAVELASAGARVEPTAQQQGL